MASQLGMASVAFINRKGITQDDVNNIIKIMELYTPGCLSNAELEIKRD